MRDIVISSKQQKRELCILLYSFIIVFLLNILSIVIYKTHVKEIITEIGHVLIITFVLYFIIAAVRLFIYLLSAVFKKK